MLLVYLFARILARRGFGFNPSYEARSLFMFLLVSDIFAELAFVNIVFGSFQFFTLLALDFIMLVKPFVSFWLVSLDLDLL